jgi:excinuclease ABC subunit C
MTDPTFDARRFLETVPVKPGVYRMYDAKGGLMYVGKASRLKDRLSSYFRGSGLSLKTQHLVARIAHIELNVTRSEAEALILEQTQIKENRPPYNVLLRDDKSYPYILLTDETWPRLAKHRGARRKKGDYFGPYPSGRSVYETLNLLEKVFGVRQCDDATFRNRSRPCLKYQIGRCKAPCVGLVSEEEYLEDVRLSSLLLRGRGHALIQELTERMTAAAEDLDFEKAARLRDQVSAIQSIQSEQHMESRQALNVDLVVACQAAGLTVIHVLRVRDGRVLGGNNWFHTEAAQLGIADTLSEFLPQYYGLSGNRSDVPDEVILSHAIEDLQAQQAWLHQQAGHQVRIVWQVRAQRKQWRSLAADNARHALTLRLQEKSTLATRYRALDALMGFEVRRMECFDISHSSGEAAQASCVVFDRDGPRKSAYRRFNIRDVKPGDDYAAMHQALSRRLRKLEPDTTEGEGPDLLLVDGGPGQLSIARKALAAVDVPASLRPCLLGIAKGSDRKAGLERLILESGEEKQLDPWDPALNLLQHIRDEAHRFAIQGHRGRRDKKRKGSQLDDIEGVGPARRKTLLTHFGGLASLKKATVEDMQKLPGISQCLAQRVFDHLHSH